MIKLELFTVLIAFLAVTHLSRSASISAKTESTDSEASNSKEDFKHSNNKSGANTNGNPFASIISRLNEKINAANAVKKVPPKPTDLNKRNDAHFDINLSHLSHMSHLYIPSTLPKYIKQTFKIKNSIVEDNQFEQEQDKEINEKIKALGLKNPDTSFKSNLLRIHTLSHHHQSHHHHNHHHHNLHDSHYHSSSVDKKKPTLYSKTAKQKDFDESSDDEDTSDADDDEKEDEDYEEDSDEEETTHKNKKKVKKSHKKSKKSSKLKKLSKKQLNQIFKYFKKKKLLKEDSDSDEKLSNEDFLISSMLLAPNSEISADLKDSVSAKSAQNLLLQWHSHVPHATLHELKEMYNKFYEYYYEHYTKHEPQHDFYHHHMHHHHYHHYPHNFDYEFGSHLPDHHYDTGFYSHLFDDNHYGHHYHDHHHHHHHNLNLLDFISSKTKSKKTDFMRTLLGDEAEIFDPDQHFSHHPYGHYGHHLNHYHHHFDAPYDYDHHYGHHYGNHYGHHYDNHYGGHTYDYDHGYYSDHLHHDHHQHALSLELQRLTNYNIILKQRLSYYSTHNMSPPVALLNEYNRVNQLITTKTLYLPEHPHYSYHHFENSYAHDFPHGHTMYDSHAHDYLHFGHGEQFHDHFMGIRL